MIRKSDFSEVFDEYINSMLKKEAGGVPEVLFDFTRNVPVKTAPAPVKTAPAPVKTAPATVEPATKAPSGTVAGAADAATKQAISLANRAKKLNKQLIMYSQAVEETIGSGSVQTVTNIYKDRSADQLVDAGKLLTSSSIFDSMIKDLEDISAIVPGGSNIADQLTVAIKGLKAEKNVVMQAQQKLAQHIANPISGAAKAGDVASPTKNINNAAYVGNEIIDSYRAVINDLVKINQNVSNRNAELVAEALQKSHSAGYLEGTAKAMEDMGLSGTPEAAKLIEVSNIARKDSVRASENAARTLPNPTDSAPIINGEAAKASEKGKIKGASDAANAASAPVVAPTKGNPAKGSPSTPSNPNSDKANGILSNAMKTFSRSAGNALGSSVFNATKKVISIGSILILVGVAGVIYVLTRDPDGIEVKNELANAMNNTIALFTSNNVKFIAGSNGLENTNELIDIYRSALSVMKNFEEQATEAELRNYASALGDVQSESTEYLDDKDVIAADLTDEAGWSDAIDSIEDVKRLSNILAVTILKNAENARAEQASIPDPSSGVAPGIRSPIAKPEEGQSTEEAVTLDIPGSDIVLDFNNAPNNTTGFRSAAQKIVNNVLASPVGLAFVDPEGAVWTGALSRSSKTPDQNYYWRTIGYLYQQGITTPGQLRRHMRHQLERWKRGKGTAWKDALKYYTNRFNNKYSMEFYLNNIIKTANLNELEVTSINKTGNSMKINKFSDEHSNSYVQDALKGLTDEYAKSYLSGLKSMYDERLGSSEGDQTDLYHPLNGSGAQTIGDAHPESITISESMGKGGLVENLIEQQRGSFEVALSTPTGNFRGKRAEILNALVKRANKADAEGDVELSNLIDEIIVNLTN
jgi:hypothetical protein